MNLGCIDLNPHPVLAEDLDRLDELWIDLDPVPGIGWKQIVDVALVVNDVLDDYGLTGWPKTSGSRGFHIYARIEPRWGSRRSGWLPDRRSRGGEPGPRPCRQQVEGGAAGGLRRCNQNAKDAGSSRPTRVRPTSDARVSAPLTWAEVPDRRPEDFTPATVLERYAAIGDPWEGIDRALGSLEPLLDLAERMGPTENAPNASTAGSPRCR